MVNTAIGLISANILITTLFGLSFVSRTRREGLKSLLLGLYFLSWSVYLTTSFFMYLDLPTLSSIVFQCIWFLGPILYLYHLEIKKSITQGNILFGLLTGCSFGLISFMIEANHVEVFEVDSVFVYLFYTIGFLVQGVFALLCIRSLADFKQISCRRHLTFHWHRLLYIGFLSLICMRIINHTSAFFIKDFDQYFIFYIILGFITLLYNASMVILSFNHSTLLDSNIPEMSLKNRTEDKITMTAYRAILADVKREMEENKRYQDSNLSIGKLAQILDLKSYLISKAINTLTQQTFFDFINEYRIKYAIELLKSKERNKRTIQEIMYDSGFNSKSSFLAAFKKQTGKTPTIFRKAQFVMISDDARNS